MAHLRILILSSNFGGGHLKTGEALTEQYQIPSSDEVVVSHLDFGSFFLKKTDYFMRMVYMNMVKKTPQLYRKIFEKTLDVTAESYRKLVQGFNPDNFLSYIRTFKPDVIVCTHFFPAGMIAEYKRKGLIQVPIVTVVTDYKVHGLWIHPGVDQFLVGSNEVHERLVLAGILPERIRVSGIPLRSCFLKPYSKEMARRKLGIDNNKKTVLIMGGASGLGGRAHEMKEFILKTEQEYDVQFLVVCGADTHLYETLTGTNKRETKHYQVYGYVNHVHELMAASDFLITKGGALTISEGLTMGLPVIMYKPIPGHEDGNATFVERAGAGFIAHTIQELGCFTRILLDQPVKRKEMAESAMQILPSESAKKASACIQQLAHQHKEACAKTAATG